MRELKETYRHGVVVLVHRVDHRVDEHLLVRLRQLRDVAKVNVRDAPILQSEDITL